MLLIKMYDLKVNVATRQPRIFTVTSFALLMDLNRPSSGFPPSFAAPAPAATPRSAPADSGAVLTRDVRPGSFA